MIYVYNDLCPDCRSFERRGTRPCRPTSPTASVGCLSDRVSAPCQGPSTPGGVMFSGRKGELLDGDGERGSHTRSRHSV